MKNLNRKSKTTIALLTIMLMGLTAGSLFAQANYKLLPGASQSIKVLGSSNVHDWTMTSATIESQGEFKLTADEQLAALNSFSLSLDAKSLKSEHESMDNRTYKTMRADQYPKVTFKLNTAVITPLQPNKYLVKATGNLSIAGTTQVVVLNVTATVNTDNTISCTGSQKIQLTDYKIDPPSFMMGAMKVKNDLTIQFNLLYKNSQLLTKTN